MSFKVVLGGDPEFFPKAKLATLPQKWEHDGVAVEYHITPSDDPEQIAQEIYMALQDIEINKSIIININPKKLTEEEIALGCDKSHNIYNTFCLDVDPKSIKYRSSGGHIHMSKLTEKGQKAHIANIYNIIKSLDSTLGLWSVITSPNKEHEKQRRKLYGRAGEYRYRNKVLEYRTLSNFWLFDPEMIKFVYSTAQKIVADEDLAEEIALSLSDYEIQYAINDMQEEIAGRLYKHIAKKFGGQLWQ